MIYSILNHVQVMKSSMCEISNNKFNIASYIIICTIAHMTIKIYKLKYAN